MRRARLRDARTQSRNIGQVNVLKMRGEVLAGQLLRQTGTGLVVDIEEDHCRCLTCEVARDRSSDPRCTTGDQNDLAREIRINSRHDCFP
jgi:hypothetical protein